MKPRHSFHLIIGLGLIAGVIAAMVQVSGDTVMGEWQPIETAPKDGSAIDVWVRDFKVGTAGEVLRNDVGRYTEVRWGVQREVYHSPYEVREGQVEGWLYKSELSDLLLEVGGYRVTHWMPPPEPPK